MSEAATLAPEVFDETDCLDIPLSQLDGDDGIALTGLDGMVRVRCSNLRALDVGDSPGLVGLDLSECPQGLALALKELPALRWVRLPAGGAGHRVELALAQFSQDLELEGTIADLGICHDWLGFRFRLGDRYSDWPVDGISIGNVGRSRSTAEVAIHQEFGTTRAGESLALDCRGLRYLLIAGSDARRLVLENATLDQLDLIDCIGVEQLDGDFLARRASVSGCSQIERIAGHGHDLELSNGKVDALTVPGRWDQVAITDCDYLCADLPGAEAVQLARVPMLFDLNVPSDCRLSACHRPLDIDLLLEHFQKQPARLWQFIRCCRRSQHGHRERARSWLESVTCFALEPGLGFRLPELLVQMARLARSVEDVEPVWLLRCLVAARVRSVAIDELSDGELFELACSEWHWQVSQADSVGQWIDDLEIYVHCRHLAQASHFLDGLRRIDRLYQVHALGAALSRHGNDPAWPVVLLEDCLVTAVARLDPAREFRELDPYSIQRTPTYKEPTIALWMLAEHSFDYLIDLLARRGHQSRLAVLVDGLRRIDRPTSMARLGVKLIDHGIETARALLIDALQQTDEIDMQLRADILARLLGPRGSQS